MPDGHDGRRNDQATNFGGTEDDVTHLCTCVPVMGENRPPYIPSFVALSFQNELDDGNAD